MNKAYELQQKYRKLRTINKKTFKVIKDRYGLTCGVVKAESPGSFIDEYADFLQCTGRLVPIMTKKDLLFAGDLPAFSELLALADVVIKDCEHEMYYGFRLDDF